MDTNKTILAQRFSHAVQQGMLCQETEHVLRMRHGIGVDPDAPLGIKSGLQRNPGTASAVREMERFLVRRTPELRGATQHDAAEVFFGHGAHVGDDAEGEAIRNLLNGTTH